MMAIAYVEGFHELRLRESQTGAGGYVVVRGV